MSSNDIPTTHEERVRACMRLMPDQWVRKSSKTAKRLAAEWGQKLCTVQKASSEAWRRIQSKDDAWFDDYITGKLFDCMDEAESLDDARDRIRATLDTIKVWAPIKGINAPTKTQISGSLDVNHMVTVGGAEVPFAELPAHQQERYALTQEVEPMPHYKALAMLLGRAAADLDDDDRPEAVDVVRGVIGEIET